jgi:hypothetical protein
MEQTNNLYFTLINLVGIVQNQADRINQLAEEISNRVIAGKISDTAFQIGTVADCIAEKLESFSPG